MSFVPKRTALMHKTTEICKLSAIFEMLVPMKRQNDTIKNVLRKIKLSIFILFSTTKRILTRRLDFCHPAAIHHLIVFYDA